MRVPILAAAMFCLVAIPGACADDAASDSQVPGPEPVLDPALLMDHVLTAAAFKVWDSVGFIVTESGTEKIVPETEDEWEEVADGAAILAEARNLLLVPGRVLDPVWRKYSVQLSEAGMEAFEAAEARDAQAVFDAGARITEACTGCHDQYGIE